MATKQLKIEISSNFSALANEASKSAKSIETIAIAAEKLDKSLLENDNARASARAKEASEYIRHARAMLQAKQETDPLLRNELKLQIELNRVTSSYASMIATAKQRYTELGMSMEVMHTEVKKLLTEEAKQVGIVSQEYEKKAQVILAGLVKQKLQEEQLAALVKEQETSKLAQTKERLDNEAAYWKEVKAKQLQYETDTRKAIEKGWEETFKLREEQVKRLNSLQNMSGFKATSLSFSSFDNAEASKRMIEGMSQVGAARQAELDKLIQKEIANFALVEAALKKTVQVETERQAALDALAKKEEERLNRLMALRQKEAQYSQLFANAPKNPLTSEELKKLSGYGFEGSTRPAASGGSLAGFGGLSATQIDQQKKALDAYNKSLDANMASLAKYAALRDTKASAKAAEEYNLVEQKRLETLKKQEEREAALWRIQDQRLADVINKELIQKDLLDKLANSYKYVEQNIRDMNSASLIAGMSAAGREAELQRLKQLEVQALKVREAYLHLGEAARLTDPAKGLIQHQGAGYGKPISAQDTSVLVNEMNQRLALIDKEYQIAAAKTKYGSDSVQVKRLEAQKELTRLEQEFVTKRADIESSKKTPLAKEDAIKKLILDYEELIAKQQKLARSSEQLKTAHIDLWQFIGKSMLIWRAYNFLLSETRQLLMSIPKVGMELETSKSVLSATMGGKAGAEVALRGLHDEAKRTGIAIDALRETWRTFSASTTIAGESVNTSWRIFTNMNTVITALHYSGDKATHIFMALAQMFNKGKIQSEELVKQLGNLIPGAFAAMAQATHHTTMELVALMKAGHFLASGNIDKFAQSLADRFNDAFIPASQSLNANLGKLRTSFIELGEALYEKVAPYLIGTVKYLTNYVDATKEGLDGTSKLKAGLISLGAVAGTVFGVFSGGLYILGSVAEALLRLPKEINYIGLAVTGSAASFMLLTKVADRLTTAGGLVWALKNLKGSVIEAAKSIGALIALHPALAALSVTIGITVAYFMATDKYQTTQALYKRIAEDWATMREQIKDLPKAELQIDVKKDTGVIAATQQVESTYKLLADLEKLKVKYSKELSEKGYITFTKGFKGLRTQIEEDTAALSVAELKPKTVKTVIGIGDRTQKILGFSQAAIDDAIKRLSNKLVEAEKLQAQKTTEALNVQLEKRGIAISAEAMLEQKTLERTAAQEKVRHLERDKSIEGVKAKYAELRRVQEETYGILAKPVEAGGLSAYEELVKKAKASIESIKQELESVTKSKDLAEQVKTEQQKSLNSQLKSSEQYLALLNKNYAEASYNKIALAKEEADEIAKIQKESTNAALSEAKQQLTNSLAGLENFYSSKEEALKQKLTSIDKDSSISEYDKVTKRKEVLKELISLIEAQTKATENLARVEKQQVGSAIAGGENYVEAKLAKNTGAAYDRMNALFQKAEATYGVSANFLKSIAYVETEGSFKTNLTSPVGAKGLMQFMPDTAKRYGLSDRTDAEQSIMAAARYFVDLLKMFKGDYKLAAAGYNAGENRASLRAGNIPNIPETQNYVKEVMAALASTGKEQAYTKEATKALEKAKAAVKDYQAQLSDADLKTGDLFKTLSENASKASEELDTALGKQNKAQESLHNKYRDSLKLADEFILKGTEEQRLKEITFKEEVNLLEQLRLEKFKLLELQNKQIVSLQGYKDQLAEIARLEQAGMMGGLWGMRSKDEANRGLLADRQKALEELQAKPLKEGQQGFKEWFEQVAQLKNEIKDLALTSQSTMLFAAQSIGNAFDTTFRGVLDGSIKAKDAFKQFGISVIKTLQDIILQELKSQVIKLAFSAIGNLAGSFFGGAGSVTPTASLGGTSSAQAMSSSITPNFMSGKYAKGGAFDTSGVIPFAKGGIVSQPTLFKFAKGTGLMGEAGAEAIMPLARTSRGDLGVKVAEGATGNSVTNIFNITVTQAKDATAEETGAAVLKQVKQFVESTVDYKMKKATLPGGMYNRQTKFG